MQINNLVAEYAVNSSSAKHNFVLAEEYKNLEQYGSALSFYLRAFDFSKDTDQEIAYTSLIRIAGCLFKIGDRQHTCITTLMNAISYLPQNPEAYLMLSQIYEASQRWVESYCFATLAEVNKSNNFDMTKPEYDGEYVTIFQKSLSAWYVGKSEESRKGFTFLNENIDLFNIKDPYLTLIKNNISMLT